MTLEKALISLGSEPLSKSAYSQAILTMVKAVTGKNGEAVTKDTLGYEVLGIIYQINNPDKRSMLLAHRLGRVRSADSYRHVVVATAGFMVFIVIIISLIEILSEGPVSGDYAAVLKTIATGFFELLKIMVASATTTATPS